MAELREYLGLTEKHVTLAFAELERLCEASIPVGRDKEAMFAHLKRAREAAIGALNNGTPKEVSDAEVV